MLSSSELMLLISSVVQSLAWWTAAIGFTLFSLRHFLGDNSDLMFSLSDSVGFLEKVFPLLVVASYFLFPFLSDDNSTYLWVTLIGMCIVTRIVFKLKIKVELR